MPPLLHLAPDALGGLQYSPPAHDATSVLSNVSTVLGFPVINAKFDLRVQVVLPGDLVGKTIGSVLRCPFVERGGPLYFMHQRPEDCDHGVHIVHLVIRGRINIDYLSLSCLTRLLKLNPFSKIPGSQNSSKPLAFGWPTNETWRSEKHQPLKLPST
jgi:hypothetical protein